MVLNLDDFALLIRKTLEVAREDWDAERAMLGTKLAYSEAEAAALLSVAPHVLRDARYRGEIAGSKVGSKIRYERSELLRYLVQQRIQK